MITLWITLSAKSQTRVENDFAPLRPDFAPRTGPNTKRLRPTLLPLIGEKWRGQVGAEK